MVVSLLPDISGGAAITTAGGTITGPLTVGGVFRHTGTSSAVNGNAAVAKAAAIASPTAPSAVYVQSEAAAAKTAIDAIRAALTAYGITA